MASESIDGQAIELGAPDLRRVCDPTSLGLKTTADLPVLSKVLGQPRAVAALAFGASIPSHGFNRFALGQPGSGRTTLIREYLEHRAETEPVPPDLCYVYKATLAAGCRCCCRQAAAFN
jgi:hypothetical protein